MADWYKGLFNMGNSIVRKTRLSNAMGVPLVFVCFVFAGLIIAYCITQVIFLLVLVLVILLFFIGSFIYIMLKHPELLRTEEHEERMMQLSIGLGQSDKKELSEARLEEMKPTTNPALKEISSGKVKE